MDHHSKQITLNWTQDCPSAALFKALNVSFMSVYNPHLIHHFTKALWPRRHHSKM